MSDLPKATQLEMVAVGFKSRLSSYRARSHREDLERQGQELGEFMAGGETCVIKGPEGWTEGCLEEDPSYFISCERKVQGAMAGSLGSELP